MYKRQVYACLKQIGAALGTEKEQEVLHEVYPTIPKISVDYGIMELSLIHIYGAARMSG